MFNLQNIVAVSRSNIKFQRLQLLKHFTSSSSESEILDIFQGKGETDDGKQYVPDIPQREPKEDKKKEYVIIKSSRSEFNHHRNQKYDKMKPIPLVSKGWFHQKSKGDFFTIQIFDKDHDMDTLFWGENFPDFDEMQLDDGLKEAIKRSGFVKPTKIQHDAIPVLLSGRNTLIAAETGCGKTLAFLVPVLQQVLRWKQQSPKREPNTPLALILTPSRELASQIGSITKEFCNHLPISCNILTGGKTKQKMLHPEFRTVDIQIATLGAMSKLTTTGIYDISEVKHLIIDESDTMLDDSFSELLLRYLRKFKIQYKPSRHNEPSGCQLTLVSATFPSNFDQTLADFTVADSFIKVTSKSLHRFLPHVPQTFYRLGSSQKPAKLLHLIKQSQSQKMPTMIFSNKSPTCDWITLMLQENGVKIVNLNGEMPLEIRKGKLNEFLSGEVNFLSCTDIASRGLDTKPVRHVINYDFPLYMADYIHRCGRTGRCGSSKDCRITNFISGIREVELVNKIEMAVRTMEALPNVNGNITKIIRKRISDLYSFDRNRHSVKN